MKLTQPLDISDYPKPKKEHLNTNDFEISTNYYTYLCAARAIEKFSDSALKEENAKKKIIPVMEIAEWFVQKLEEHAKSNAQAWLRKNQQWINDVNADLRELKIKLGLNPAPASADVIKKVLTITAINVAISTLINGSVFKLIKFDKSQPLVFELQLENVEDYKIAIIYDVLTYFGFKVSRDELNKKIRLKTDENGLFGCDASINGNTLAASINLQYEVRQRMLNANINHNNNMKAVETVTTTLCDIAGPNNIKIDCNLGGTFEQPDPSVEINHANRLNEAELKALIKSFENKQYMAQKSQKPSTLILRPTEPGFLANFDAKGFKQNYITNLKQELNHVACVSTLNDVFDRLGFNERKTLVATLDIVTIEGKIQAAIIVTNQDKADRTTLTNLAKALEENCKSSLQVADNKLLLLPDAKTGRFSDSIDAAGVVKRYNMNAFMKTYSESNPVMFPSKAAMKPVVPTATAPGKSAKK